MRSVFAIIFFLVSATASAQRIGTVSFGVGGGLDVISIELDANVIIFLKDDGTIRNWGVDLYKERGIENYNGQLENYMGRTEYYTQNDDAAIKGKLKVIGRYTITWYASYEGEQLQGKIKSIGSMNFMYYDRYDEKSLIGRIKSIGAMPITYYSSYDNEGYRGKLKSIGGTSISYYGSFDDKAYAGKVKSVGGSTITYHGSTEKYYAGMIKSGNMIQYSNGIKFYIR